MNKYILSILLIFVAYFSYAQCSSCTMTLTANSTADITVDNGDVLCIQTSGTNINFSHELKLKKGGIIHVCTNSSDTLVFTSTGSYATSNPSSDNDRTFNNHGNISFTTDMAIRRTDFNNNGYVEAKQNFIIDDGIFTNNGTLDVKGGLEFQSGGHLENNSEITVVLALTTNANSSFSNNNGGIFTMSGDAELNGDYTNAGTINANALTLNAGGTVDISGGVFIANDLTLNAGSVSSGTGSSCAAFLIKNTTAISSAGFSVGSGEVVIVDSTNIGSVDVNNCATNCGLTFDPNTASSDCFNNVILPLTWLEFQVNALKNETQLYWVTAHEENVSHFEIERSINGYDFVKIGDVKANNQLFNQYYFYDNELQFSQTYYRIKQIDIDGNLSYSELKFIKRKSFDFDKLYPNPTTDYLNISFFNDKQQNVLINLINYMGTIVYAHNTSENHLIIPTHTLSNGIYILVIQNSEGEKIEHKIFKK